MVDITKCTGGGCPIALTCHRYTAQPNPYWQSYVCFSSSIKATQGGYACEFFIPGVFEKQITSETKS